MTITKAPNIPGLALTRKQFKDIYGDNIDVRLFTKQPVNDTDLMENYLTSKLWRLNNLYYIINKVGKCIPFKMNVAQHMVYAASLQHARLIILKSRQQGISTFWLISFEDDAIFMPNFSIGLMAQGLDEAATLLERVKTAWRKFPEDIKAWLGIEIIRDNTGLIGFNNGSTIFIRTSFRSTTLQRLHISEYGKICARTPERAKETKTGTLQAIASGNTVVIESTAEGDNDFKILWEKAIMAEIRVKASKTGAYPDKDFKPVFLSWLDDPDCVTGIEEIADPVQTKYFEQLGVETNHDISKEQCNFWIAQYRELDEDIYQEYPATPDEAFAKRNEGCYYAALYMIHIVKQNRIIKRLYDPNIEVNVALDLGTRESDTFFMIFYQPWKAEMRIIHEYEAYGEGLEHYVKYMRELPYKINWVISPHDMAVFELGAGKSRLNRMRELGVMKIRVLEKSPIVDGIEQVRKLIPHLYIDETCTKTIKCIRNYSKDWDTKNNTWKNKPRHDQYSHGADALRYLAMANIPAEPRGIMKGLDEEEDVVDGLCI